MITQDKENKITTLLREGRSLFHTQDLGVLWGIKNTNTLYTTIKRYVKNDSLYRIYKGFYSTLPINKIDPVYLGLVALHRYGYLSVESVLAREGIIFQDIKYITLISDVTKKFELGGHKFLVRRMDSKYLYNDAGIIKRGYIREASQERAVADMLYFNNNYHFDAKNIVDWKKILKIKKQIGY